ncbi:MAG: transcription termination/antitermination NusG family protein, partial [Candidatus Omnitrophota bacterium]|nr:transcription termination/antitermination NusG family protein [Candidatus Omnitrophota bacterium]
LYTKSRHEKLVESQLPEKGIEAFTPKITIKKRWSDRIQTIEEPLFKSYCFARFSLYEKTAVLSQRGVVKAVHFNGQYIPVKDSVIESLKILVASKLKIDPCPYLKEGHRVFIKTGPLKGLEGFISEKRKNNSELVVSIDAIGASVKCVVDIDGVDLA